MSLHLPLKVRTLAVIIAVTGPVWAQDDDVAALAAALKEAKFTLQDGLKASEREGRPISAQFEIDNGKLELSVYTAKGDDFTEVIADANSGAVVSAEKITDNDDLNDAMDQKAAMDKATVPLLEAVNTAEKENPGSRVVGIFADIEDGHAVAQVTLLQGTTAKKVSEKLD